MQLESARQLKEEALDRFVTVPGATSFAVKSLSAVGNLLAGASATIGVGGDRYRGRPAARASIGLGVALGESGDCKLAVRYPWHDTSRAPHLDELREMTRGEIDVEWSGPIVAQVGPDLWCRQPQRPLNVGTSVAHKDVTAGTICAFVQRGSGAPELLSCNHILANCDRASINDAILQPGPADGGTASDAIGRLAFAVPLERSGINTVDCAVAALATGVEADHATLKGYGSLAGLVDPAWYGQQSVGEPVAKIGRTTEATTGHVTVISFTAYVAYPGFGRCFFDELIEVKAGTGRFSAGGDSGSMVFTPTDRRGVGMVIGGTPTASYVSRLDTVLSRLSADLVV